MKQIKWEFYHNPFKVDCDVGDEVDHHNGDDESEFEDSTPWQQSKKSLSRKPFRVLMTTFGMIPLTEDLLENKNFKLWIGHTNFSISVSDATKLAEVPGVEAVKFFSRYRFLVLIGTCFTTSQVKLDIQATLCDEDIDDLKNKSNLELDKRTKDKFNNILIDIENKENYIIYVLPNGKIISYSSDTYSDEFNQKVMLLTTIFKLVGGSLHGS